MLALLEQRAQQREGWAGLTLGERLGEVEDPRFGEVAQTGADVAVLDDRCRPA
jgi:hypothetical protein